MITLSHYKKYLDFSPEQFQNYQLAKIKKFVTRIRLRSRYYAQKLQAFTHIESYADFQQLPLLEQDELRNTVPDEFRACSRNDIRTMSDSSGTTGKSKVILWTENALQEENKWNTLEYLLMGLTSHSTLAMLMSLELSRCLSILEACRSIGAFALPIGRIKNDLEMDAAIERMRKFGVTHVHGSTSRLISITQRAKELGYSLKKDFKLKYIYGGAMSTSGSSRKFLEDEWGARFFDTYGSNETSFLAGECTVHKGLHVFPGINFIEVVHPANGKRITDNKTTGEIVVTNFSNLGTPLLRYRIGDLGTMTYETCRCGLSFPRIYIKGRTAFTLCIDGTKLNAYEVDAVLAGFSKITSNYQVIVRKSRTVSFITFRIECFDIKAITSKEIELVVQKLEKASVDIFDKVKSGWIKIKVHLLPLGSLERTARDKIKNQVIYANK